jgi:hypothetical protein
MMTNEASNFRYALHLDAKSSQKEVYIMVRLNMVAGRNFIVKHLNYILPWLVIEVLLLGAK